MPIPSSLSAGVKSQRWYATHVALHHSAQVSRGPTSKREFPLLIAAGRYSCVGKVFGLAEMRAVTAELVKKYRFRFATPDTKATFLEATRDCFTARIGRLDLVFSPRD